MRSIYVLIAFLLFYLTSIGRPLAANIENETPMIFTANNGTQVDAYQGQLMVKENRDNPSSRHIRINYVRFPATRDNAGPPIIYLAGGPGGSGIRTAQGRRFELFMAMREFGDVIALDQRGTGQSQKPEQCMATNQPDISRLYDEASWRLLYREAVRQCFVHWQQQGIDIYGYNTTQNALDINDLRLHLGAEKVSLWGISYGSHLALAAVKEFAEHIDKLVLASVEGLSQTVKLPARTDAYFQRVQDVLNAQALGEQVPDLLKLMRRVHQTLNDAPLELTLTRQDGTAVSVPVNATHLQRTASFMIADPGPYLATLIQLYQSLGHGDSRMLQGLLQQFGYADRPLMFDLMPTAMDISSGISAQRLAMVEQQANDAVLGLQLNFPMPLLANLDPRMDLGEHFRRIPQSDIPVLVLSGTLDGRTYPTSQREALRGMSAAQFVTVANAGHNLFMSSPAVTQTIQAFMRSKPLSSSVIQLPLPALAMPAR
ncbi:alpha/beta hydrolase [Alteromonas gilva]|uniref:Alpha/beta hydrolase n=1 Tax=Alteromonas gilva TaxID=2987522 RepID=A0ABT5L905_9ALTE|nr:alpha/beta hydrolase [Alteromonas gilva]MDC8832433.1 alpha/beta hydrolase [Alteromonas gilva]